MIIINGGAQSLQQVLQKGNTTGPNFLVQQLAEIFAEANGAPATTTLQQFPDYFLIDSQKPIEIRANAQPSTYYPWLTINDGTADENGAGYLAAITPVLSQLSPLVPVTVNAGSSGKFALFEAFIDGNFAVQTLQNYFAGLQVNANIAFNGSGGTTVQNMCFYVEFFNGSGVSLGAIFSSTDAQVGVTGTGTNYAVVDMFARRNWASSVGQFCAIGGNVFFNRLTTTTQQVSPVTPQMPLNPPTLQIEFLEAPEKIEVGFYMLASTGVNITFTPINGTVTITDAVNVLPGSPL